MNYILPTLLTTSYSYGFYRAYTLPIWDIHSHASYKDKIKEFSICIAASSFNGLLYVLPPTCIVQYMKLGIRMSDINHGYHINYRNRECWQELGFRHPNLF